MRPRSRRAVVAPWFAGLFFETARKGAVWIFSGGVAPFEISLLAERARIPLSPPPFFLATRDSRSFGFFHIEQTDLCALGQQQLNQILSDADAGKGRVNQ